MKRKALSVAILFFAVSTTFVSLRSANAECRCVCMNGSVDVVCTSTFDLKPICPPRVCPNTPPSLTPLEKPRLPPIGTSKCVQKQIFNERTRRYEWREVCY
jgi:hypothetical protein